MNSRIEIKLALDNLSQELNAEAETALRDFSAIAPLQSKALATALKDAAARVKAVSDKIS